jgi:RimJ/RimL family protein N-acetyltransferase
MLQTANFKIRPLQISDKDSLAKNADNYKIAKNLRDRFPHPYSIKDAEDFIAFTQESNNLHKSFGIIKNGECIGVIGFIQQTDVHRKNAEFGYWIGEAFWQQGIITEACKVFIPYVFENFEIVRLFASVFEYNIASQRVLEKNGFKLDCITEKSVYKENQFWNEHHYSLLSNKLL